MRYRIISLAVLAWAFAAIPTHAGQHVVGQKGNTFSRTELTIQPNEEVLFTNDDDVVHNVFSATAGMTFNLKAQPPGDSSGIIFAHEGTAEVRCVFHPTMKLKLTVKK
ncbi:MAG: hypothetical protein HOP18_27440 [Deltaproteobacteria bacterium]|nr:hypothetical protein [Deltaproteobacteria bacterium]